jgi:uncharacterized UBP type Zn finger protein
LHLNFRLQLPTLKEFSVFARSTLRCAHPDQINDVTPSAEGSEQCLRTGDAWVHLREHLICGDVGCCGSSKNRHATRHFHATQHPLVQSFQPGEDWIWCYVDEVIIEPR